ncbi:MAG: transcriptional regulator [Nitrospirae bacterium]|jgi:putative FmdB family regulatory protein|nr:transcriptional regulator [Nitrospirota bacterium]
MPIYEYQCHACNKIYEKIQKFSDPVQTVCEVCGGPVVKLLGKPALQFKGSGFYITDYVRKGNSGESSSTEGTKKSGETSSPSPAPAAAPAPSSAPAASSSGESKSA